MGESLQAMESRGLCSDYFQEMAELSSDLVFIESFDGRVLYLNPAARNALGLKSLELAEFSMAEFYPEGPMREAALKARSDALEQGSWVGEVELYCASGSNLAGYQTTSVHRDSSGVITGLSSVIRDIRHLRELEQRLRLSQRLESIGHLAGGVAHDFNNLLTVIDQCLSLIGDDIDRQGRTGRALAMALQASGRAASLCRQLLGFAQKQVIQPQPTDLNHMIREFSGFIGRIAGEDICFDLDLCEEIPPIMADPSQLDQVLANLVVNARDA
ncbi:MAG: PAS domain S-box protein, partial [Polyangiaceae bacterium]|nr:PAS domain S-box protein [Polyangiaceae bacterium]